MSSGGHVRVARVYEDPDRDDGVRVLVDRLWPRGFRKGDPRIGRWIPQVAPSSDLRRWYSHQAERFDEFAVRYADELESPDAAAALAELREAVRGGPVTLVTAARDLEGSHVTVLAGLLS